MGARKQADLTDDERTVLDALYDLQTGLWRKISAEAREQAARAAYSESLAEQLDKLPDEAREGMLGVVLVGGETPRYLRVPRWPEMSRAPRLSLFTTPAEIHKALAQCDDCIKASQLFREHRDLERVWKILDASLSKSLRDLLEQRSFSGTSSTA
jgi:hypothetical protein